MKFKFNRNVIVIICVGIMSVHVITTMKMKVYDNVDSKMISVFDLMFVDIYKENNNSNSSNYNYCYYKHNYTEIHFMKTNITLYNNKTNTNVNITTNNNSNSTTLNITILPNCSNLTTIQSRHELIHQLTNQEHYIQNLRDKLISLYFMKKNETHSQPSFTKTQLTNPSFFIHNNSSLN